MKIAIPNREAIELKTLILDLNGTLTVKGKLILGVSERIAQLQGKGVRIILLSGDTRGTAKAISEQLNIELMVTSNGEQKRQVALVVGPETCVAIGNGLIDVLLFKAVLLSIATLQAEGIHGQCLQEADIIVPSILDALDLLIEEKSLIATLRP